MSTESSRQESPPCPLAIDRVVEAALYADDLDEMVAFYTEVLGLPLIGREAGRHAFFRVGMGSVLLVFQPDATLRGDILPAHGTRGPGHVALGIAVRDFDAWRQRLEAHGVAIEKEQTWQRGGRSLFFRDPAGNAVELITPGVWGTPEGW